MRTPRFLLTALLAVTFAASHAQTLKIFDPSTKKFDNLIRFGGFWTGQSNHNLKFDPNAYTLFLVHGTDSTTATAWEVSHAYRMKEKVGYQQILGVDYTWQDPIVTSASNIAAKLQALGLKSMDVEAHSLGVPVAMAVCSQPSILQTQVPNFISLAGALMGTSAADKLEGLPQLGKDVFGALSMRQLTTKSTTLQFVRDSFDTLRPSTRFIAIAAKIAGLTDRGPGPSWLGIAIKLAAYPEGPFDGIINTSLEQGDGSLAGIPNWTHQGNMVLPPAFKCGHIWIHESIEVIDTLGSILRGEAQLSQGGFSSVEGYDPGWYNYRWGGTSQSFVKFNGLYFTRINDSLYVPVAGTFVYQFIRRGDPGSYIHQYGDSPPQVNPPVPPITSTGSGRVVNDGQGTIEFNGQPIDPSAPKMRLVKEGSYWSVYTPIPTGQGYWSLLSATSNAYAISGISSIGSSLVALDHNGYIKSNGYGSSSFYFSTATAVKRKSNN